MVLLPVSSDEDFDVWISFKESNIRIGLKENEAAGDEDYYMVKKNIRIGLREKMRQ